MLCGADSMVRSDVATAVATALALVANSQAAPAIGPPAIVFTFAATTRLGERP